MWLLHVLGIDNVAGRWYGFWSGFGSDLAIIAAVVGSGWTVVRRMVAHHKALMAQGERHHSERQALLTAHHNARLHQAEKHHGRLLDAVAMSAPKAAEPQVSGGSTPFDSRERLDGPPAAKTRVRRAPKVTP